MCVCKTFPLFPLFVPQPCDPMAVLCSMWRKAALDPLLGERTSSSLGGSPTVLRHFSLF